MPTYVYQHPKTKKVKEIIQTMNEPHVYEEKGIQWVRLFTVPQATIDANIDPFSQQQFIDKTGAKNGKIGDAWDRAAELSDKRAAQAGGVDPIKDSYYKKYAKTRKGKPHPKEIIEKADKTFKI